MIKLPKKEAFIFDMDGVIVDNISYHIKALKEFLKGFGKEIDDEYFQQHLNGRTMQEVVLSLKPDASKEEVMRLTEEKEALYRSLYKPFLSPTLGLLPFLMAAKKNGIRMAVATSAVTSNATFTLEGLSIREFFDVVVDSTMVTKGKPDPEIYLMAAKELNVAPKDCLVFEDALAGIQSAKNAGMDVVGIASSLSIEQLPGELVASAKDFQTLSVPSV
ncbi:MAG: beta-phosphoglucomutase [Marivirga sp.]|jgi:beta-phosphoglucomutase